jgi:transcription elongation factor Elf1
VEETSNDYEELASSMCGVDMKMDAEYVSKTLEVYSKEHDATT